MEGPEEEKVMAKMFDRVKDRMLKRKQEELKSAPAKRKEILRKDIQRLKKMKREDIPPVKIKAPSLEPKRAPLTPPHNVAKRKKKKLKRKA